MVRLTTQLAAMLALASGAVATVKSSGCGKPLDPHLTKGGTGQSNALNFTTSAGEQRTYLLHIPTNFKNDRAQGLIFSFHGRTKNATEQEGLSQFSNPEFNPDWLAVYPDGIDHQWQGDPAAKTNDVAFTLELMKHLTDQFCINEDTIYAAGKSNGGGFAANILACDPVASTKFAAFASASGAYYQGTTDKNCNPDTVPIKCNPGKKPVHVIETHGTADTTIPYNGGPRRNRCLPSVPHFMTEWNKRNGFGSKNESTIIYDGVVDQFIYGPDDDSEHYRIKDLAHQWPSTVPNDDGGATVLNGTEYFMYFFINHSLDMDRNNGKYASI